MVGGDTPKEFVQRILKKLFTNKFASNCSWLGHRNNIQVSNLTMMSEIQSIIINKFGPLTNEKQIQEISSEWFRFAKQRATREKNLKKN